MDRYKKKIISIGGGGFTHESDESLDQFVLNQLNKKKFKIGFLPTASQDNQKNCLVVPGRISCCDPFHP